MDEVLKQNKIIDIFYCCFLAELSDKEMERLEWILLSPFQGSALTKETHFPVKQSDNTIVIEIGPRYEPL